MSIPRDDLPRSEAATEEEVVRPAGPPPPPERHWWVWLLLLLLLVVGGLLLWFFLTRGDNKTTVPKVVGLQESAATKQIEDHHLKSLPNTGPSSKPVGVVFAQNPGSGVQVDKGQTVTISISAGPAHKTVPNVTGLKLDQAEQQLQAAGFKFSAKHVASSRPKGIVASQTPVGGVTAVAGTTVQLLVSNGKKPVIVPSLVGQTQGAAVSQLTKLGLKSQLQNVSSSQPVGLVVAQKPKAGTEVDKASTVVLNISKGTGGGTTTVHTTTTTGSTTTVTTAAAATRRIPRVQGLAVTAGLRRLNRAGLHPVVRYVGSSEPAGRIVSQSPSSGSAKSGSPVHVNVSNGPNPAAPATVPKVVGQDQASAASALRDAGFKVQVLFRKTTDQTKNGIVVDEQPVAGSSIPSGSYVAIFVGRFSG